MPNNYLSVLYKIIQVENDNVGLKVGGGGHKHTIAPNKKVGAHATPCHGSTTGVTKAVVCVIMSVEWCI